MRPSLALSSKYNDMINIKYDENIRFLFISNMENLENQEGRDLIKSINSLKRDFPPLVTVLMAFQMGGIHFVLSIPD